MRSNRHTTQTCTRCAHGFPVRTGRAQLFRALAAWTFVLVATLVANSCQYDRLPQDALVYDSMAVELNIQTRSVSGIVSDYEGFEAGSEWENYINIDGGDYRVYFFTYNPQNPSDASSNNVLIAEFVPTATFTSQASSSTTYTLTGNVGEDIAKHTDFKVVVLANWGQYPTVTPGSTTIDDIVGSESSTFAAERLSEGVDRDHLIPFYGVNEYSGVTWKSGWRLTLPDDITLLRAVAKVEVVMSAGSEIDTFESVSVVGYNSTGYCAPEKVYLKSDYDHGYTWAEDFVDGLHLVGGANDPDATGRALPLVRQQGAETDTWTAYLPEYDNLSDTSAAARISVRLPSQTEDEEPYTIRFSNYSDGTTDSPADYDIHRNYLYRFTVTVSDYDTFWVYVEKWSDAFDNNWTFGTMEGQPREVDDTFTGLDGNYYVVTSSDSLEVAISNYLSGGQTSIYSGDMVISEQAFDTEGVLYYTVTGINSYCFYNSTVTSVVIPETVTTIGNYAFNNSIELKYIVIYNEVPPTCGTDVFLATERHETDIDISSDYIYENCILYVPDDSVDTYKTTDPWSNFKTIMTLSEYEAQ